MKCLVTGANGFVGRALCTALINKGVSVRAATRETSDALSCSDVVKINGIDANTDWTVALKDVDTVVHLAARVHMVNDTSIDPLTEFRRINVDGTLTLARQAAAVGVKRFLFISSIKVNGEMTQEGQPYTEEDRPAPQDAYGLSKLEAEVGLQQIAAATGLEIVIIRPPLVYGPGVKANFATLMHAVKAGWPLPLGAIKNLRSLVALDNLVDFIVNCTNHPQAANQTFLISDGHDLSTTDLVRGLALAAGVSAWLLPIPVPVMRRVANFLGKDDVINRLCGNLQVDISKAKNLLGWEPPIAVEDALNRVIKGIKS